MTHRPRVDEWLRRDPHGLGLAAADHESLPIVRAELESSRQAPPSPTAGPGARVGSKAAADHRSGAVAAVIAILSGAIAAVALLAQR